MNDSPATCYICGSHSMQQFFEMPAIGYTLAQRPNQLDVVSAFYCYSCSHVQASPPANITNYYSNEYEFQLFSPDEDDIYSASPGRKIFRAEHQAAVVAELNCLRDGLRVLDYGSGKARTLALLTQRFPKIDAFAFDVSEQYKSVWSGFLKKENQATFSIPDEWNGSMDLVTSFFALEHTVDPQLFVRSLRNLLRPGGRAHVVVPNMYENMSDLVVADHIQHYSALSIQQLFLSNGFCDVNVDTAIHQSALVVTANYTPNVISFIPFPDQQEVQSVILKARQVADNWYKSRLNIQHFEARHPTEKAVIYGSGVYGSFILKMLRNPKNVIAFVDANPFRQGRSVAGISVVAPASFPFQAKLMYAGLNPNFARRVIADAALGPNELKEIFYL